LLGFKAADVPRPHVLLTAVLLAPALSRPLPLAGQGTVVEVRNLRPVPGTPGRFDTLLIRENIAPDSARDYAAVTDVAADSGGHILAVDVAGRRIIVLDRDGRSQGALGRAGDGPGEFRLPALLAVDAEGTVIVLDVRTNRLTYFDRDLRFARSVLLQGILDGTSMVAIGTELFVAGRIDLPEAQGKVIHVFSRDGRYQRSFGRLVEAASPMAQDLVSGGRITPACNGGVWFSQRAPYLIERYAADGTLQLRLRRPNDFLPSAESAVRVQISGRTMIYSPPAPHARAAAIVELDDGTLLNQTYLPGLSVVTDVFRPSSSGDWTLVASFQHPGPVLVRRGLGGTYLGLVTREEGVRPTGIFVVRYTPAAWH
jgi:hypothetical protein